MRKILILSLLFVLLAGNSEAQQTPWEHYLPTDEMTGKKDYRREKVGTVTDIEKSSHYAGLIVFCGSGEITFVVGSDDEPPLKLDATNPGEKYEFTKIRTKFDNNEPTLRLFHIDSRNHNSAVFPNLDDPEINKIWKELIKGMIKHHRLWIEFQAQNIPHIAKFDLTGFSRELAKCSKIPDTN